VDPGTGLVISAKCVPAGAIVNVTAFDVPPPGAGLDTVTLAVPTLAMSAATMDAVNCVLLTKVVVRLGPFQLTTDVLKKFAPLTLSVNAPPPAAAVTGLKLDIEGTGFFTEKDCALEVPPPGAGLTTATLTVPAVAMSAAVMAAVTWVPLIYVVVRLDPSHLTTDVPTKFVPLTVSVNAAPPALAIAGLRLDSAGTGLFTEKACALEVPPPGDGLTTVTLIVPADAISAAVMAAVT
jgi:hypothetical protein